MAALVAATLAVLAVRRHAGGEDARARPEASAPEAVAAAHPSWGPEVGALLALLRSLPAQPPVAGPLSSPYGWRADPLDGARRFHEGVDLAVPEGTPVRAPADGVVVAAGEGGGPAGSAGGYGLRVRIRHEASGLVSILAHLSALAGHVEPGRRVARGDVVGYSGRSGRATGPHLHFGVYRLDGGAPVDPVAVFDLYAAALDALAAYPEAYAHAAHAPYQLDLSGPR